MKTENGRKLNSWYVLFCFVSSTMAEYTYYDNEGYQEGYNTSHTITGGDGMEYYSNTSNSATNSSGGDIDYWTNYAIFPKRCIVYKKTDYIMYEMFDQQYCQEENRLGTYISRVPDYMTGHLQQLAEQMSDLGVDDYTKPEVAQYIECTPFQIQGAYYYFQIGCADGVTQKLAVNIYSDNTCSKKSTVDGFDDSVIDVSALNIPFKQCQTCVNWVNVDGADDQFYIKRQQNAPLCKTAWTYKKHCGRQCQSVGRNAEVEGWNASDKILISVLSSFALILLGSIAFRRQKMPNKDILLEQAFINSAGLRQSQIFVIIIIVMAVIAVLIMLGLKDATWALLLVLNTALFAYLMKLTLESSVNTGEIIIGPDGTILRKDSDDSSIESTSNPNNGTYMLPTLT